MARILRFVVDERFRLQSGLAYQKKKNSMITYLCSCTGDLLTCYLTFVADFKNTTAFFF